MDDKVQRLPHVLNYASNVEQEHNHIHHIVAKAVDVSHCNGKKKNECLLNAFCSIRKWSKNRIILTMLECYSHTRWIHSCNDATPE